MRDVKFGHSVVIPQPDLVNLYGCFIGDATRVGAFVEVQKNSSVGSRCKSSSHTFICEGVTIEDRVLVAVVPPIGEMACLLEWSAGPEKRVFYVCIGEQFPSDRIALRMVKEHSEWIGIRSPGFADPVCLIKPVSCIGTAINRSGLRDEVHAAAE